VGERLDESDWDSSVEYDDGRVQGEMEEPMIGYRIHDLTETPVRMLLTEDTYSMWSRESVRDEVIQDARLLQDLVKCDVVIEAPGGREIERVS
jgi:hypothetical protein